MAGYAPALKKLLRESGCRFDRPAKGDHEVWYSPQTGRYERRGLIARSGRRHLGEGQQQPAERKA